MKLNFSEILEGWKNHILPPKALKDFINQVKDERLAICAPCPYNSANQESPSLYKKCTLCNCPFPQKQKSLSSSCGAKAWNESHPTEEPKPILWEAITDQATRYEIEKYIENEK